MTFTIGETIGAYRIIEPLGQGGMATVYKAYHAALDRFVALKVMHPAFMEDDSFLVRFQREAKVVAKLDHPNIVSIFDFSEHEKQPYLVMKYIDGETLKAHLQKQKTTVLEMLPVIDAVANALTYAHKHNIVHRDVKPSNIILTPEGHTYLTDFGLARIALSNSTSLTAEQMIGTPQYISPEQALSKSDLDFRTDIYSFGVVLYEIATGQVPFNADTPFAVIHDHIYTPLPLPSKVNPSIPPELERVLLKALAKNPKDRYTDVSAMVKALRTAITHPPESISLPVYNLQPVIGNQTEQPTYVDILKTNDALEIDNPSQNAFQPQKSSSEPSQQITSKKKNKALPFIIGCFGILVFACLIVGILATREERIQTAQTAQAEANLVLGTPMAPHPLFEAYQPDFDQVIQAWQGQDVIRTALLMDEIAQTTINQPEYLQQGLDYLVSNDAPILALWLFFTANGENIDNLGSEELLMVHQYTYIAARDPNAGIFFDEFRELDILRVASIRFELYNRHPLIAQQRFNALREQQEIFRRFPEMNLLNVEIMAVLDNPNMHSAYDELLLMTELPDWIHNLAVELGAQIQNN